MENNKNLLTAAILSMLLLLLWQIFFAAPQREQARIYSEYIQKQNQKNNEFEQAQDNLSIANKIEIIDREESISSVPRVKIETDKIKGSISLKGLRFDDISLKEYKVTNDPDSQNVTLFSPSNTENPYFAEFGWVSNNQDIVPNSQTIWSSDSNILNDKNSIQLFWDNQKGQKFIVNIKITEDFLFEINRKVENYSDKNVSVSHYGILNRNRDDAQTFWISHEGAIGHFDEVLNEVKYKEIKDDKKLKYQNVLGWFGFSDKYWLSSIIPSDKNSYNLSFQYFVKNAKDFYQLDYLDPKFNVAPSANISSIDYLFVGPKKALMLEEYGEKINAPLFDRAVDFGMLYFITKPIFKVLTFLYDLLGNFGLAILALTVLLKLMLYPLANKSYVSMHHLKRLAPELTALKERYKNDKMALNKAVMDVYKKEKVSPMSGCLPLIIQIPIFFALYKVLFVTIEMRHAPFYGWINDLSAPDPTNILNLFGLLPFDTILGLSIGIWPLIMAATMVLQQKMNPKPADPTQAKVMAMLPYIFIFLFAGFPAGLVIYWAWNNILSVLQQWFITKRLPK